MPAALRWSSLQNGSSINGDTVELHSDHLNVDLNAESDARCSCGGGDTDARANAIFRRLILRSKVEVSAQRSRRPICLSMSTVPAIIKADPDKHAGY